MPFRPRTIRRRWLVAGLALLVLLKLGTTTWRGLAALHLAGALQRAIQTPADLGTLTARYLDLINALADLNGEIGFLYPVLRLFPGDLGAAPDLAGAGLELGAASKPLAALGPMLQEYLRQPDAETWNALLRAASALPWAEIQARLDSAGIYRDRLLAARGLSGRVSQAVHWLDDGLTFAGAAARIAPPALQRLADGREHQIVVLAQNSDELRATGGFITAALILTIHADGRTMLDMVNSYAIDDQKALWGLHPVAPAPMLRYMDLERWMFRDSNWSPDFPTAARLASRFYALHRGQAPDMIAAANLDLIRAVVDAVGPIRVAGQAAPLDGSATLDQMRLAWDVEPGKFADADAKAFLTPFLDGLASALAGASWEGRLALVSAVRDALARRELMLYADDPAIQAEFLAQGWAGELRGADGDTLQLVETNIGYNKVNPKIERRLEYHVSLADLTHPFAQVQATFRNANPEVPCASHVNPALTGYAQRVVACYWNLVRIVAPKDSALLSHTFVDIPPELIFTRRSAPGAVSVYPEGENHQVFEGLGLVPAGQARAFTLTYRLPEKVVEAKPGGGLAYRLLVQKQPGVAPYPLQISLDLPPGIRIESASPPPAGQSGQTVTFVIGALDRDFALIVNGAPSTR